jgi:hypothetical protein
VGVQLAAAPPEHRRAGSSGLRAQPTSSSAAASASLIDATNCSIRSPRQRIATGRSATRNRTPSPSGSTATSSSANRPFARPASGHRKSRAAVLPGASSNRASPSKIRQYHSDSSTKPPPVAMPVERTGAPDHCKRAPVTNA